MRKILVVSNMYPSFEDPTYGVFVCNFLNELKEELSAVHIDSVLIKGRSQNLLAKICKYICFYVRILYKLCFLKYDIVYVHIVTHAALPLRIMSIFKKLPFVFNIHGEDLLTKTRLSTFFLKLITPLLYESLMIVLPSAFFKERFITMFPQINKDKLYLSASGGIDESVFYPRKKQKKETFSLGYVSRIDRGKGWDLLLYAIQILNKKGFNIQLTMVGSGIQVSSMLELKNKLGLNNIDYLGAISHDNLAKIYSTFDVFIFPTCLEESLGLVAIEAMACGVPVIGSKIGGLTDYIEEGVNGFYFIPENINNLAVVIEQFLKLSDSEKNRLGMNAVETSKRYSKTIVSHSLNLKINNLMK